MLSRDRLRTVSRLLLALALIAGAGAGSARVAESQVGRIPEDSRLLVPQDHPEQTTAIPTLTVYDNLAPLSDSLYFAGQNGGEILDDLHGVVSGPLFRVSFDYFDPSLLPDTVTATVSVYAQTGGTDLGATRIWGPHPVSNLARGRNRVTVTTPGYPMAGANLWMGVRFSSPTAGLIIHETPNLGGSHDLYRENGGLFNFLGNPKANFGMKVEVVDCAPGPVIFADQAALGSENGASWVNAFTTLQDALTMAEACPGVTEVWVAAGVYKPTSGTNRNFTFKVADGVQVYGGFVGFESSRVERDWVTNPTVLNGDIGAPVDPSDNSRHVVTIEDGVGASTVLDGFTITDGNAGSLPGENGGGIWNPGGSPTLSNLTLESNTAFEGGGMASAGGSINLVNVAFRNNTAAEGGGGLHTAGGNPILVNTLFFANSAGLSGGGFQCASGDPVITNGTFSGNSAGNTGGGVQIDAPAGTTEIWNSIFWGNSAFGGGAEVWSAFPLPLIFHSLVSGAGYSNLNWNSAVGMDGGGNRDLDPRFVDEPGGNLHVSSSSGAVEAGSNFAPNLSLTDLDGNPRILYGSVDMGAYESTVVTGVEPRGPAPGLALRIAPNPVRSGSRIYFSGPEGERVSIDLFDVRGRRLATILDRAALEPGEQSVVFPPELRGGVYFLRIRAGGKTLGVRATILR